VRAKLEKNCAPIAFAGNVAGVASNAKGLSAYTPPKSQNAASKMGFRKNQDLFGERDGVNGKLAKIG
jgi:hypothetical protein